MKLGSKDDSPAGWDGRALRPFAAWRDADEFIESRWDGGHVRVGLWDNE